MKRPYILLFALALTACGEPTIDTSTDETMRATLAEVRSSLPEADRDRFDDATTLIIMSEISSLEDLANPAATATGMAKLDGMTADEVFVAAAVLEKVQAERKAEEDAERRRQVLARLDEREKILQSKVAELEALEAKAAADKATLDEKLIVAASKVVRDNISFMFFNRAFITLTNNTDTPISYVRFHGTIKVPGRTTPFDSDTFGLPIKAGIEPGETLELKTMLTTDSGWALIPENAENYVLEVTPISAQNAAGETFLDGQMSESQYDTLNRYRAELEDIQDNRATVEGDATKDAP